MYYNPRTEGEGKKAAAAVNDGRRRTRVAGVECLEPEAAKTAASGDPIGVPRVDRSTQGTFFFILQVYLGIGSVTRQTLFVD